MTREEAEIYAKTMTYEDALYNLSRARAIPYRKATFIKVNELIKALSQEPCTVSVSEKEPNEITEEVTLRFFKNTLKVRWHDFVIYNVEWLKKHWQMEMDIVCGVKPCDDLISREDAFEIIASNDATDGTEPIFTGRQVVALLSTLPSVTQKSGKWIIRDDLSTVRYYQCSECNEIDLDYSDYCPNCGAKMESEE